MVKWLALGGKLVRNYTQNIDMLENKAGLSTDLSTPGVQCVQLHGSLRLLRCSYCSSTFPTEAYKFELLAEDDLPCPQCVAYSAAREAAGRRRVSVGILLPDIVRIGQQHPSGEDIGEIIQRDLDARPHLLLILGTSLKLDGPKKLATRFARAVKKRGAYVVYVNLTRPPAVLQDLVDYWVKWDCEEWTRDVGRHLYLFNAGYSAKRPIEID
jgi:NAD-dependent histone deacetylase SIR2